MCKENEKITLALGCDHAGYPLMKEIKARLADLGYNLIDLGCDGEKCNYPVYAEAVCEKILSKEADFGLLFCGTGAGMMMCANKHRGIRAMLAGDAFSVGMCRSHNNANLLALGARVLDIEVAWEQVKIFLTTPFDGGRHLERVLMFDDIL